MINRAMQMYQVEIYAPTDLFTGTLLDGELVYNKSKKCLVFLVFDVVCYKGKSTITMNYIDRYEIINNIFPTNTEWNEKCTVTEAKVVAHITNRIISVPSTISNLLLYSKPCVPMREFERLYRTLNTLNHESDGFIFTPIYSSVRRNTHKFMYKWKYKPTIDLLHRDRKLFGVSNDGQLTDITVLFPEYTFTYTEQQHELIEMCIAIEGTCINLTYLRTRTDKKHPNSKRTILSVLHEIIHHISIHDIVETSSRAATFKPTRKRKRSVHQTI
jgi:hypothetical protein